jgi:hypothetical protein
MIYPVAGCEMKMHGKRDDLARARAGIWTSWFYFGLILIVLAILGFAVWYMAHVMVRSARGHAGNASVIFRPEFKLLTSRVVIF